MELTEKELADKIEAAVEGLKNKNTELLGKLTSSNDKLKGFEDIDFERLKNQSKELTQLKLDNMSAEEKVIAAAKIQAEERIVIENNLLESNHKLSELIIDNDINTALASVGQIKTGLSQAAVMYIKSLIKMVDNKPTINGADVLTFVKTWFAGEGKEFFNPKYSGGDGNEGNEGTGDDGDIFDKKSSKFNLTKQAAVRKNDINLYNSMIKKYNK